MALFAVLVSYSPSFPCNVNAFEGRVCGRGISPLRRRPKGFAIALWKPSPDRSSNYMATPSWQVAAALSADVTTTKLVGKRPHSQAEPAKKRKSQPKRQPLFGRGGLGERGFSQRSRLSPSISPPPVFSGGSAREGTFLQKSPLPRIFILPRPWPRRRFCQRPWQE